jgi:small-conductance mechanosensitive channel
MQPEPSISLQISTFWAEASGWVVGRSVSIILALIFGAILVALLYGLRVVGKRLIDSKNPWRGTIGRALASMRIWFMAVVAAQIVAVYAHAPEDAARTISFVFIIAATLQAALFLRELILGAVEARAGEADASGTLGSAIGLIRLLVNVVFFLMAAILILANLGVNVTGLLAGLGIGGIAIGLAAQGIFSDLFAALSILFDKPFRRGDFIRWEGTTGTVEEIGLKSTRIRAISGEQVIISNTNLLGKELRNFARIEQRRFIQVLSLVYQTPVAVCEALPCELRAVIDGREGATFVRCGMDAFAASSLDFQLVFDVEGEDQDMLVARKHAVNTAILDHFGRAGIQFAYPTQTTFTAAPDGRMIMPFAAPALPADIVER